LADVFGKAAQQVERERRLLDREPDPASSPEGDAPTFAPWPDCRIELIDANAQYHAATLLPGTRASAVKRLLLRLLNVYTFRQILFNAAVVRILNRWDERLHSLGGDLSDFSLRLTERLNRRLARIEERRSLWEARLAGQLGALEDRTGAAESDLSELQSKARQERARVDALEDSVRRLEAFLASERETTGAETPR
jgi:hypothetical protein